MRIDPLPPPTEDPAAYLESLPRFVAQLNTLAESLISATRPRSAGGE
jgi:hypothetical protein